MRPVHSDVGRARGGGGWRAAGRLLGGLLVAGVLLAGGSTAGAATKSGAVPDAGVDATIHADQLDLISLGPDRAVAAASTHLDAVVQALALDRSALARDTYDVANAARIRTAARSTVRRDTSTLTAAVAAHRHALRAVATDSQELQGLAVGWYTGASSTPSLPASLASAQQTIDAVTELTLLTHLTAATLERDTADAHATGIRVADATASLDQARAVLASAVGAAALAGVVLSAAHRLVASDQVAVAAAGIALSAASDARTTVIATFERSEGAGPAPVPSILGPAAMTAPEIVAWFDAMGYAAATRATIGQLAASYLSEGQAEGVRGDVAFAQAMVETGGFDSEDAVALNNFAGIGHCDSCAQGLQFGSALAGVRAQIQLLRTYADPTLTSADLPSPPPIAALAPQKQGARGCCQTWNSLTGVWATDPVYGTTVLAMYAGMLAFAVRAAPEGVGS